MRFLKLSKSGTQKIHAYKGDLRESDFDDSLKSLTPGEWVCFLPFSQSQSSHDIHLGYVNPFAENHCAYVVEYFVQDFVQELESSSDQFLIDLILESKIKKAFELRTLFKGYESNSRLFYGASDGLPGLIIDQYENAVLLQLNTAGVDSYRDKIKKEVEKLTEKKVFFLDHSIYRQKEGLPNYQEDSLPDLNVQENGLKFKVRSSVIQKIGFYYDHRENRWQLYHLLQRMNKSFKKGLDLFCYAGAWGMTALAAKVMEVDFIDQGDFAEDINTNLKMNGFENQGTFYRQDVFRFLDQCHLDQKTYDVIMCDPPAFAKSLKAKNQALEGYSKLHRKVFKLASEKSLVVFSSCTHYVSRDEFEKNILNAARREKRKLQLLYSGVQGFDHPIESFNNQSNYIKSYLYLVE